ncbi:MAG: hypothetical protein FJ279_38335 [Planctomycetes bacterium]|nr:hypothetical protein [Planctomycetota bacterium]
MIPQRLDQRALLMIGLVGHEIRVAHKSAEDVVELMGRPTSDMAEGVEFRLRERPGCFRRSGCRVSASLVSLLQGLAPAEDRLDGVL